MEYIQAYNSSSTASDSNEDELSQVEVCEKVVEVTDHGKKQQKTSKKLLNKKKSGDARIMKHYELLNECKCVLKCQQRISSDKRRLINQSYWNGQASDQKNVIFQHVKAVPVKRRRSNPNADPQKKRTYKCVMKNDEGEDEEVCLAFFLNTLGYKKSNSHVVYRCFESIEGQATQRGKYEREKSLEISVKADILAYNPSISHYRREHSPNIRYLPSDLTRSAMYLVWKDRRKDEKLPYGSYSFYCKIIKELKIRFTVLGNEECEECLEFGFHEKEAKHDRSILHSMDVIECQRCKIWFEHIQKAGAARAAYTEDKGTNTLDCLTSTVDLQKVR